MKTTRIILIVMLVAATVKGYSNPVDANVAKRVAQNFMSKSRSATKTVSDIVTEQFEGYNSFYVINFHEGGWVMVSAENTTVPVLAFSIDGIYSTDDEKPEGLLLKDCGEASGMTYACAGSFTTDLESALISVLPQ